MNKLEKLENEAFAKNIDIKKADLPENISGIYYSDGSYNILIAINSSLKTRAEQTCIFAEELGHYYTSYGNLLLDPNVDRTLINQQETRAKRWAAKKLVPIRNIIEAFNNGSRSFYEMAEYLDVTVDFLHDVFHKYSEIYGRYKKKGSYVIYFDPPGVYKLFNKGE